MPADTVSVSGGIGRDFSPEPAALYLHIPFCRSKCHYCSFNSRPLAGQDPHSYLAALTRQVEILGDHPLCRDLVFTSLYMGGGTPTVIAADKLGGLLTKVMASFSFADEAEISIEANPNGLGASDLVLLRQAGFNRISIGVQSLDDDLLALIGRSHNRAEAQQAVALARQAGFDNISLDLIYGLPGQTLDIWRNTLEEALTFKVKHLSLYELMVEPATPLAGKLKQGQFVLPGEDEVADMEEVSRDLLDRDGYGRYEIANFAQPGYRCRHNMTYWRNGDYLGLGAGAVSCLKGLRFTGTDSAAGFTGRLVDGFLPISGVEALSREARLRESVVMALRMMEGFSLLEFERRFGVDILDYYGDSFHQLLDRGLLLHRGDNIRLADRALPLANQVLQQLV